MPATATGLTNQAGFIPVVKFFERIDFEFRQWFWQALQRKCIEEDGACDNGFKVGYFD
jgi:hypothetical protein